MAYWFVRSEENEESDAGSVVLLFPGSFLSCNRVCVL